MEDTLRAGAKSVKNLKVKVVLILVLMEDTLRVRVLCDKTPCYDES